MNKEQIAKYEKLEKEVMDVLEEYGLELNEDQGTISDVCDYIFMTRVMEPEYSPEEWVKDTLNNFPECFK